MINKRKLKGINLIVVICLTTMILVMAIACTKLKNQEKEKGAVAELLNKFTLGFETKNLELLSEIFSHDEDMVNFGTDADEVWIGWEPLKKSFQKQFAAYDKIKIAFDKTSIKIHSTGTIAWFSTFMSVDITSHEQPFHYDGMRMTGVAEKRNGVWIFVQRHVALPVREQAVEY